MLDKSVIAAVFGAIGLMVLVTFWGKSSPEQAPSPAATVSSTPSPPLSDAALFKKYDAMPPSERFPLLTHDDRAKAVYLREMSRRVDGNFDRLSKEEQYFADSATSGHGQQSVEAYRGTKKTAARTAP